MSVSKECASLGESIDIGSQRLRVATKAADPIIEIVNRYQEDVWFLSALKGAKDGEEDQQENRSRKIQVSHYI